MGVCASLQAQTTQNTDCTLVMKACHQIWHINYLPAPQAPTRHNGNSLFSQPLAHHPVSMCRQMPCIVYERYFGMGSAANLNEHLIQSVVVSVYDAGLLSLVRVYLEDVRRSRLVYSRNLEAAGSPVNMLMHI